jgi:hypothetical protein
MELAFRTKARFYTSSAVIEHLGPVTNAPTLAVLLDIDALERHSPVDRVTLLALHALARADVHIRLISHDEQTRLSLLRRGIPLAWISADRPRHLIPHVRQHVRGAQIIAFAHEGDLVPHLAPEDRGVDVSADKIRAVLWWLVHSRVALTT